VFLFDEPLSNLDAKLRGQVRAEIKALSQQLKTTMVFVTHDQVEAMTMADRIVVLKSGTVQQYTRRKRFYERPANQFVAGFNRSPTMNFFPVEQRGEGIAFCHDGAAVAVDARSEARLRRACQAVLGIRPEHFAVAQDASDGCGVTVKLVEPLGSDTLIHFDLAGGVRDRAGSIGVAAQVRRPPVASPATWKACTCSTPKPARCCNEQNAVTSFGSDLTCRARARPQAGLPRIVRARPGLARRRAVCRRQREDQEF